MSVRDESLRRAVAALPCVACGAEGRTQHAHSNLAVHGKGRGLKSGDEAGMALCTVTFGELGCHEKLDQLIDKSYDEAEALTYTYIARTYMALVDSGFLKVDRKKVTHG